jgi:hypothetical protein
LLAPRYWRGCRKSSQNVEPCNSPTSLKSLMPLQVSKKIPLDNLMAE